LKYEIRYGLTRADKDYTESVAEHSWGMHVVLDYFLPLEPTATALNHNHLRQLLTWHDTVELVTGDKISWQKTSADEEAELVAWKEAIPNLPSHLQETVASLVDEYEHLSTPEAKFAKAIDKTEPVFHMYTELGKQWSQEKRLTRYDSDRIKLPFLTDYPVMQRFVEVIHNQMEQEGFFSQPDTA
jgi:5'-deoxynucleotidase YfbR-like HD superfamily hydrolase